MNKIISKERFSEKVFKFEIEAPLIAKSRKAGHFVIVRVGEKGERMPLTIAGSDLKKGTITLVVQEVGLSSTRLCELNEGESITDVVGPLGQATHIEKFGTVICAGGGVGVAPMLPIVQALKAAGNRVITVLAGRNKDLIILEKEMRESSDEVIIMTDDGSYGRKGLVTEGVEEVIKREKVDKCFAKHYHGGRNWYVRRLPYHCRRKDQIRLCRWSGIRRSPGEFRRNAETYGCVQEYRTRRNA